MTYSLAKLNQLLGTTLVGDGTCIVAGAKPIAEADSGSITFVSGKKYLRKLSGCNAAAVVVPTNLVEQKLIDPGVLLASGLRGVLVADDAQATILKIARMFLPPMEALPPGIDPLASVHPTATIDSTAHVGPFAVVGAHVTIGSRVTIHPHAVIRERCIVGEACEIHPHAVLYPRVVLGNRVTIHAGAVVGGDGFGFTQQAGKHVPVPQLGTVEVGDDVSIGCNSTIDRGMLGATRIGQGTKIDNLVQVAHNCQLGDHNLLVAQAGIAGSCVTGAYAVFAGQSGVADHVTLGEGSVLAAGSGTFVDIPKGETYMGFPARPEREAKRHYMDLERVGEMRKQLARVVKHLGLDNDETALRKAAG